MAKTFGACRIFGCSMLLASTMTLLTPMAAKLSFLYVVICRMVLGFASVSSYEFFKLSTRFLLYFCTTVTEFPLKSTIIDPHN